MICPPSARAVIRGFFRACAIVVLAEIAGFHAVAIPPAPQDTSPVLRADQIHQLQREKAEREGVVAVTPPPVERTETAGISPDRVSALARKYTGLTIAKVADTRSRRSIEVQADQILVRLKPGRTKAQASQALARYQSAAIERKTAALEKLGYWRARVPAGVATADFLARLSKDASVECVEFNVILRSQAEKPADPTFGPDWGLQAILAIQAWEITQGDPSVIVAVVDSGIAGDHPDLADALVPGYNFIADNTEAHDDFGHGTQVAGIIAARSNAESGTTGVAPRSRVMPLKVLDANGEGTAADVAEAIVYAADAGTRVITLALGTYAESGVLQAAIEYASARNCLIIAAGGNNGTDELVYPAAYPQTLAVAALDQFRKPCFFSNRAPYIDIAAPGIDILTTAKNGGHSELTGTSASAAHVAGLAALLLAVNPALNADTFQAIIRASASDLQTAGWDAETGFGLADCVVALNQPTTSLIDVGIVDVMAFPQRPRPDQTASIVLTLRNHGVQPVQSATLVLSRDGHAVATTNLPDLAPKQTRELTVPWVPLATDAETTLNLLARIDLLPSETAMSDNLREVPIPVTDEECHDLAILDARAIGAPLKPGATVTVKVTIANLGNVIEDHILFHCRGRELDISSLLTLRPGERNAQIVEWSIPNEAFDPLGEVPWYGLWLGIIPITGEISVTNNNLELDFGFMRGDLSRAVIPFHACGTGKEVHQWIAKEAYKYFQDQVDESNIPQDDRISHHLGQWNWDWDNYDKVKQSLIEGTWMEDQGAPSGPYNDEAPWGSDYYLTPFIDHFCAGGDGDEIYDGIENSALTRANWWWGSYAKPQNGSNKPLAHYYLGHVVHLLTDMCVPAHTHKDSHADLWWLGGDYDYFEKTVSYNNNFQVHGFNSAYAGHWSDLLTALATR